MNKKVKKKWLAALRSEEYRQGFGYLRHNSMGQSFYCCLGVLTDLYLKEHNLKWIGGEFGTCLPSELSSAFYLDIKVQEWAGFTESDASVIIAGEFCSLSYFNDEKKSSFLEIADIIETHL